MEKKIVLIFGVLFLLFSVVGCHTIGGVGEDVQSAGRSIQKW
jgi:predicted small secreted protein